MSKHIKQLKQFVYDNAGNNQHEINEEHLQDCLSSIEHVLRSFFKGRKHSLSPSGTSAEPRKIWHLLNKTQGENRDQFKPTSRIKMLVSSVAEFLIVFLMKEAGVKLHNEQSKIKIKIRNHEMTGSNDYGLNNLMYDFKCTNDEDYRTKWRSASTLAEKDYFSYIGQLGLYDRGVEWSNGCGGWDVYNLNTGDIKHISAKKLDYVMDREIEHLEDKIDEAKKADNWYDLPPCYPTFVNKQGEEQLDWRCARCAFVDTCFPDFKKSKRDLNQVSYIK